MILERVKGLWRRNPWLTVHRSVQYFSSPCCFPLGILKRGGGVLEGENSEKKSFPYFRGKKTAFSSVEEKLIKYIWEINDYALVNTSVTATSHIAITRKGLSIHEVYIDLPTFCFGTWKGGYRFQKMETPSANFPVCFRLLGFQEKTKTIFNSYIICCAGNNFFKIHGNLYI